MSRFPWRDTSEDIAGQSGSQWETPGGAQEKADKAEENAEKYSDDQLAQHVAVGTHPAENIIESPARRFASDTKIAYWDNKADGNLATQTAKGMMSPEDKAKLDKSTNGMTPDTLMLRDAGGRAKVAAPSAANDIARKQEVDDVQANLNTHTGNTDIHTSAAEHAKLAGIQAGAEVNQNAFSKVNDVQAGTKTDGLTMKGGTGITVTTNPITKELMITATGSATPGPHASSHITGGTDVIPDAVIDGNSGLMSGADAAFVRRDGETKTGAQTRADAAKETAMSYTDEQIAEITPASLGAETPAGAQAKADAAKSAAISSAATDATSKANTAETNAKNYVDSKAWQKAKVTADDGKCILLPAGTDLNTVIKNGFYNGNNLQNAPTTTDWWFIEVLEHTNGDTFAIQKAYSFYSLTFYMRIMQSGVWGAWSQDLFTSVANGKSGIANAISDMGVPTSPEAAFATMAANIRLINTGKPYVQGVVTGNTDNNIVIPTSFPVKILILWQGNGNYGGTGNGIGMGRIADGSDNGPIFWGRNGSTGVDSFNNQNNTNFPGSITVLNNRFPGNWNYMLF